MKDLKKKKKKTHQMQTTCAYLGVKYTGYLQIHPVGSSSRLSTHTHECADAHTHTLVQSHTHAHTRTLMGRLEGGRAGRWGRGAPLHAAPRRAFTPALCLKVKHNSAKLGEPTKFGQDSARRRGATGRGTCGSDTSLPRAAFHLRVGGRAG